MPLIPDTPAGRRFAAWLTAGNSGDREALRRLVSTDFAAPTNGGVIPVDGIVGRQFGLFTASGGFTLRRAVSTSPEKVSAFLQEKRTGYGMQVGMAVTPDSDHKILGFSFRRIEAPADLLPATKLTDREIRDRADALLDRLVADDAFSGVVLATRDGKPIYQRAVGMANRGWKVPNRIDTKFNVASIGKMFTAVAIAQLVEQGKISYDDTLAKTFPEYGNREIAEKITIRHLLNHTSGLNEARGPEEGDNSFRRGYRSVREYLSGTANDTLTFEPGTRLEYSSYTYTVLGAVIEEASGQDYYDYIRDHIYKPAGMRDSDSYELDTDPPNLATGYMDAPGGKRLSNIFKLPVKGLPFGLGYATAGDLVRFATALRENKLLSAASLAEVWTGVKDYSEPDSKYGLGFIVKTYNGTRIAGHGGGWVGITNKFDTYPDLGCTVVILSNIDSDPNAIAFKFREWLTQGR